MRHMGQIWQLIQVSDTRILQRDTGNLTHLVWSGTAVPERSLRSVGPGHYTLTCAPPPGLRALVGGFVHGG